MICQLRILQLDARLESVLLSILSLGNVNVQASQIFASFASEQEVRKRQMLGMVDVLGQVVKMVRRMMIVCLVYVNLIYEEEYVALASKWKQTLPIHVVVVGMYAG